MATSEDNNAFDVVVVGSCMTDLVSYVSRLPKAGETLQGTKFTMGFGGKGANQCIMASRLGCETSMVAKLGNDTFGQRYMQNFRENGVDVSFVTMTERASTGVAPITVNASGENSIVIISGANLHLSEEDVRAAKDLIISASVLICQLEIRPEVTQVALSIAKKAGVTTVFNPAPAQSWLDTMFYKDSDVFCANETEAEILTGVTISGVEDAFFAIPVLLGRGAMKVVITLGEHGSVIGTQDDPTPRHIPTKEVKPLDTTGAGDAFVGALAFYLSKYKGLTFDEMVRRSNEIAAISVCGPGTQTSYPTVEKLPPALFDPPGVNSCPQRSSQRAETIVVHPRKNHDEIRRALSSPAEPTTTKRSQNEVAPSSGGGIPTTKGAKITQSKDDTLTQLPTKKSRSFFGRRKSEGSVNPRKHLSGEFVSAKANGQVAPKFDSGKKQVDVKKDGDGKKEGEGGGVTRKELEGGGGLKRDGEVGGGIKKEGEGETKTEVEDSGRRRLIGRRGSVPQIQGVALQMVETDAGPRETMIDS